MPSFARSNKTLAGQSLRRPAKTADGHPVCRWCSGPVTAKRRRTFCSEACVHEFKLQTNPGYVRDQVFKRDQGICQVCGCDTPAISRVLCGFRKLDLPKRTCPNPPVWANTDEYRAAYQAWNLQHGRDYLRSAWCREQDQYLAAIGFAQRDGSVDQRIIGRDGSWLWAADHIRPVVEGGGLCGLDNLRTLCWVCHREASAELAARRAVRRKRALAVLKTAVPIEATRGELALQFTRLTELVPGERELVVDRLLAYQLDQHHPGWTAWPLGCLIVIEPLKQPSAVLLGPGDLSATLRLSAREHQVSSFTSAGAQR